MIMGLYFLNSRGFPTFQCLPSEGTPGHLPWYQRVAEDSGTVCVLSLCGTLSRPMKCYYYTHEWNVCPAHLL